MVLVLCSPVGAEEEASDMLVIDAWNLELRLPERATSTLELENNRLFMSLGWEHTALLELREHQQFETERQVSDYFAKRHDEDASIRCEQLAPEGLSWRFIDMEVSIGSSHDGFHMNRLARVSRLFLRLPLDSERELVGTFYLERTCSSLLSCDEYQTELDIISSIRSLQTNPIQ
jgi:hypothetical protein